MQLFFKRWSWVAAAAGLAAYSSGAMASVIIWNMSVSPAADTVPMTVVGTGDGFGNGGSDNGSPHFAGVQNGTNGPVGTARYVDSGATGNQGMYRQGFGSAWTADLRISVEVSVAPSNGSMASFRATTDGGTNFGGRTIGFLDRNTAGLGPNGGGNGFRLRIGQGVIGDSEATVPDSSLSTTFHSIRLVFPGDQTVKLYDLEQDLDAGPGVNYVLLKTFLVGGGSTGMDSNLTTGGGLFLNSDANNGTTAGRMSLDWLAVNNNTALGATDVAMVPEPATLAMLVLGCVPMLIRRRRAA